MKRDLKIAMIVYTLISIAVPMILMIYIFCVKDDYTVRYSDAYGCTDTEGYESAITSFSDISQPKDSYEKSRKAKYNLAIEYYNVKDYDKARRLFTELGDYRDSGLYLARITIATIESSESVIYDNACSKFYSHEYAEALELFKLISNYDDSADFITECELQIKGATDSEKP